jgi:SAM-dependent methyltransferase
MTQAAAIFDAMRQSEMNDWVGGSDPEAVGDACVGILNRYITINEGSRLLDSGCGVGRVLVALLKRQPIVARITGLDIVPRLIAFCDEHIAAAFPNASFKLIQGSNDHYDQFIAADGAAAPCSQDSLLAEDAADYSGAYAFSVFTHVKLADFKSLLQMLGCLLEPDGALLFTCFLLTPYSRRAIGQLTALFPFGDTACEEGGDFLIGNRNDRLGLIAFHPSLAEQMAPGADLHPTRLIDRRLLFRITLGCLRVPPATRFIRSDWRRSRNLATSAVKSKRAINSRFQKCRWRATATKNGPRARNHELSK